MSRKNIGLLILLAGSLALGAFLGWLNYGVFKANVPPAAVSEWTKASAPVQFVGQGLLVGVLIFIWSLLAVVLSRGFRGQPGERARGAADRN